MIEGHRETRPVRSKRFFGLVAPALLRGCAEPAALNAILNVLEAVRWSAAQGRGSPRRARRPDLASIWRTSSGAASRLGPSDGGVAENPPVRFRCSTGMQPLPVRGGDRPVCESGARNDFVLVVAWLLGALRAGGRYPVLAIAGEQGSAKAPLSKLLRR
jgi:hypothetical protein